MEDIERLAELKDTIDELMLEFTTKKFTTCKRIWSNRLRIARMAYNELLLKISNDAKTES